MTREAAALALAFVLALPLAAADHPSRRLHWTDVGTVLGKTIRIAMPDGAVVTGQAVGADELGIVVEVAKSTDRSLYPGGPLRIPRAAVRTFDVANRGTLFRWLLTGAGAYAGHFAGERRAHTSAGPFWAGVVGGGTIGYFAGRRADLRWTRIEVLPEPEPERR